MRDRSLEIDPSTYRRLTSALFAAALDATQWQSVLSQISSDDAMPCHLFGFDLEEGILTGWLSHGCDPDADLAFREHYHALDPYPAAAARKGKQDFAMLRDLVPDEEIKSTAFYNQWMKPQDRLLGGGGIVVSHSETSMMILGTLIPERRIDRLEEPCERMLRALVAPTRHAWAITRVLAGGAVERAVLAEEGGRDPAILVLGRNGRIVFANGIAEDALAAGDLLRVDRTGRLRFTNPEAAQRLSAVLAGIKSGPVGAELRVAPPGQSPARISISQINPEAVGAWELGLALGIHQPSVVVVMTKERARAEPSAILRMHYSLTSAEAEVATALAAGSTPSEIAEARAVSLHTVRNQIKAAMAKCGARRQAELAALVARTARIDGK